MGRADINHRLCAGVLCLAGRLDLSAGRMRGMTKWQFLLIGIPCAVVGYALCSYTLRNWNQIPLWLQIGETIALVVAAMAIRAAATTRREVSKPPSQLR